MDKRVYIHPASGVEGKRKALLIGGGALIILMVLGVQLRLTFSERAIAKARDEMNLFGEGIATGVSEAKPEEERVEEIKDAFGTVINGLQVQLRAQEQLSAAASEAAARLETQTSPQSEPQAPANQ